MYVSVETDKKERYACVPILSRTESVVNCFYNEGKNSLMFPVL